MFTNRRHYSFLEKKWKFEEIKGKKNRDQYIYSYISPIYKIDKLKKNSKVKKLKIKERKFEDLEYIMAKSFVSSI